MAAKVVIDTEKWKGWWATGKVLLGILTAIAGSYASARAAIRAEQTELAKQAVSVAIKEQGILTRDDLDRHAEMDDLRRAALERQVDRIEDMMKIMYRRVIGQDYQGRRTGETSP